MPKDRQEIIALLDQHQVGAAVPSNLLYSYRETLADALMDLPEVTTRRFCTLTPGCRLADGHANGCERS